VYARGCSICRHHLYPRCLWFVLVEYGLYS
jgi:hypothetical protein